MDFIFHGIYLEMDPKEGPKKKKIQKKITRPTVSIIKHTKWRVDGGIILEATKASTLNHNHHPTRRKTSGQIHASECKLPTLVYCTASLCS
jgi:hypothetical protein